MRSCEEEEERSGGGWWWTGDAGVTPSGLSGGGDMECLLARDEEEEGDLRNQSICLA